MSPEKLPNFIRTYWRLSAILQLQCINSGVTTVLHWAMYIIIWLKCKFSLSVCENQYKNPFFGQECILSKLEENWWKVQNEQCIIWVLKLIDFSLRSSRNVSRIFKIFQYLTCCFFRWYTNRIKKDMIFMYVAIVLQMLDGDMYEKVRDAFIVFARTELECCGLTQECFTKIMSDAGLVSRCVS